ncbi:salicylate hydroxylase [Poronia punctata]|nr:salicylate hydroxylase [Poronia punctata]
MAEVTPLQVELLHLQDYHPCGLANALKQIPHIQIDVYEAAAKFSERGGAVELSTNALQALAEIFPAGGKDDLLKRAGAVSINSSRSIVGLGPHAGKIIFDAVSTESEMIVHRASLLSELVAPLPRDLLHTNKKLASIAPVPATHRVAVNFEDGTSDEFDGVIGSDDVHSLARLYMLQSEADKYAATPAGFWDCWVLVPMGKAQAVLGKDLFKVNRQCGYVGDGAFLMHDVLDDRKVVQCVISAVDHLTTHDRKCPLNKETLTKTLRNWPDGPIAKGMIQLEHKETPHYWNGAGCLMGDAAHAMTPWQGSGAEMAFEDVMIMQELFSHVRSPTQIGAAFKAFDSLRRPRRQGVIDSSRETGIILCRENEEAGLDPEKLASILSTKWNFIAGIDMKTHKTEAVIKLKEYLDAIGPAEV